MTGTGITQTYDARNLLTSVLRTNGIGTSYTYDALGRILSIAHSKGATGLISYGYSYDPTGNRSASSSDVGNPLAAPSSTASVDDGNELTVNGQTTYTHDKTATA